MKRGMDLAREIPQQVEDDPAADGTGFVNIRAEGHTSQEISYHVQLMAEKGLLMAHDMSNSRDGLVCLPTRLTISGHEFLTVARNDNLWNKTKAVVMEKLGTLSIEAMKITLAVNMKQLLGG